MRRLFPAILAGRFALVLGLGVPALAIGLGQLATQALFGDGDVMMVGLPGEDLTFALDGEPPQTLPARYRWERRVPQGDHVLTTPKGKRTFHVGGTSNLIVPIDAHQCFAVFDRESHEVLERLGDGRIVDRPWKSEAAQVNCSDLSMPDNVLAATYYPR